MTAVAPPPNFQNLNRQWSGANGTTNGISPMPEDYRMFVPRKTLQRANSSSSIASTASSTGTIQATAGQTNGVGPSPAGEGSTFGARKKPPRGLWPTSKTEPISGISTARPQPIASTGSGSSAASAISALHSPAPMVPSQHNGQSQTQQNGAPRPQPSESTAILHLVPMNGTFERKTITVPFFPDVLRIGRQTNNKTIPTPLNGYFDSKVLSRQHAEVWADRNGKIWIRDVKSSNGTFVNGSRLSQENRDSDPHELQGGDMLELGIDIVSEDQKTIVHHKVAARVEHAGIYTNTGNNMMDLNFGDLDSPQIQMGPNGQPAMGNVRGRTPSQGSINGGRMQGPGGQMANNAALQAQRHTNFWLQPITMEQVVKKLNAEIKSARQQSQELQQTHHYISSILTNDHPKEPVKPSPTSNVKVSPIKDDLKARFSEPPAPPPQQPLPEKPDAHQISLKRSETERPKTGSPSRNDSYSQMSSLTDALNSARREIESQSTRLRDLETLLSEERRAREDAEERANRLERESAKESEDVEPVVATGDGPKADAPQLDQLESRGLENGSASPTHTDTASAQLQQKLDLVLAEMSELKQLAETYRLRAEAAELESATHRQSLAEMVEKIRLDDAKRATQATKRRSRSGSETTQSSTSAGTWTPEEDDGSTDGEITIINGKDVDGEGAGALVRKLGEQNGQPVEHKDPGELNKASQALATRLPNRHDLAIAHGAPAVSIFTVVALGVAVMAWLNSYPKADR